MSDLRELGRGDSFRAARVGAMTQKHLAEQQRIYEASMMPGRIFTAMANVSREVISSTMIPLDVRLAACRTRRKAAIMKAAQAIGQPYP